MVQLSHLFCFFVYLINWRLSSSASSPKLIGIITNGFPGNLFRSYLHLDSYRTFQKKGVWSTFMYSVFPTKTLPTLQTFGTGEYPSKHGIVNDFMYDSKKNAYFMGGTRESDFQPDWWNQSQPFWISATKAGLAVAMFHWPGCQIEYGNVQVKTCVPYAFRSSDAKLNVNNVKTLISAIDHHDMVFAYYHTMDEDAHKFGRLGMTKAAPNNSVENLHHILFPLLQLAQSDERLNVLVISTHGVTDTSRHNSLYLEDYLSMDTIHISLGYGALKHIIPLSGKSQEVFHELRHKKPIPNVKVYYTNPNLTDLKPYLHYEHTTRIPEIVLIAQPGNGIYNRPATMKQVPLPTEDDYSFGIHGYDNNNNDMLGVFLAYGKAFRSGYKKDPLFLIDVCNLICHLFEIHCSKNDGVFDRISDVLNVKSAVVQSSNSTVDVFTSPFRKTEHVDDNSLTAYQSAQQIHFVAIFIFLAQYILLVIL